MRQRLLHGVRVQTGLPHDLPLHPKPRDTVTLGLGKRPRLAHRERERQRLRQRLVFRVRVQQRVLHGFRQVAKCVVLPLLYGKRLHVAFGVCERQRDAVASHRERNRKRHCDGEPLLFCELLRKRFPKRLLLRVRRFHGDRFGKPERLLFGVRHHVAVAKQEPVAELAAIAELVRLQQRLAQRKC